MTIYTNSFVVTGAAYNTPIYTNSLAMNGYSNMNITSDLFVDGNVYSSGRLDVGATVHATFRLASNTNFGGLFEFSGSSNSFAMDWTASKMTDVMTMPLVVPSSNIYNEDTGIISVPIDGLYSLEMQGSFSNDWDSQVTHGVYYKLLDRPTSNCRVAGNIAQGPLVSTCHVGFLNGGERLLPVFYSSDSNTVIVGDNSETYVSFTLATTFS